jgi:hypothetical protein
MEVPNREKYGIDLPSHVAIPEAITRKEPGSSRSHVWYVFLTCV